jgi:hypothetical protein
MQVPISTIYSSTSFSSNGMQKYVNFGTMILNNYRQALQIIDTKMLALEETNASLGIGNGDLDK